MSGTHGPEDQRWMWNRAAKLYQQRHAHRSREISYGSMLPTEADLGLLGDLTDRRVLELGCGDGWNCVALVHRQAVVTGVDISDEQIRLAQNVAADRLSAAEQQRLSLVRASATKLNALPASSQDWVLAVYLFPYVADLAAALGECARVLRPGGRLLVSQDHPMRACFWDQEMEEETILPMRSYFDRSALHWRFSSEGRDTEEDVEITSFHHPLTLWFQSLVDAGLIVRTLLEFPLPADVAEADWAGPYLSEIGPWLPQTMILVAEKGIVPDTAQGKHLDEQKADQSFEESVPHTSAE